MRRPSLPLPSWVGDLRDRLHYRVMWLLRGTVAILTRVFGPYLPSREAVRNTLSLWLRRYSGLAAALALAILPILLAIVIGNITEIPTSQTDQSWWVTFLLDTSVMATFVLLLGMLAVYFLRILYWFQKTLPRHWNRHTPPHVNTKPRIESETADRSVADVFGNAEGKARTWFGIATGFFMLSLLILLGLDKFFGTTEVLPEFQGEIVSEDGLVGMLTRMLGMLPVVGEVYDFMEELPGNTLFGKIFVNGSAALFAVGLRNWMYLFEHIDYVRAKDSNERPRRYTFYLGFCVLAVLLSTPLILILITIEFTPM